MPLRAKCIITVAALKFCSVGEGVGIGWVIKLASDSDEEVGVGRFGVAGFFSLGDGVQKNVSAQLVLQVQMNVICFVLSSFSLTHVGE